MGGSPQNHAATDSVTTTAAWSSTRRHTLVAAALHKVRHAMLPNCEVLDVGASTKR
jgi:hypothetical protein